MTIDDIQIEAVVKNHLWANITRDGETVEVMGWTGRHTDRLTAPLIGKELDYLCPMMVHHPRQAYVALDKRKGTS